MGSADHVSTDLYGEIRNSVKTDTGRCARRMRYASSARGGRQIMSASTDIDTRKFVSAVLVELGRIETC